MTVPPPPYKHQIAALDACLGRPAYALLMDMRTGKTRVIIDEACALFRSKRLDTLLVIAPLGVHEGWLEQWAEYSTAPAQTFSWRGGETQREQRQLKDRIAAKGLAVFTFNWDTTITKRGVAAIEAVLGRGNVMMVADESHRMKTPGAARTRRMIRLRSRACFRRILTGTPVANNPLDLYCQFLFLDPGILGAENYYSFRARYAVIQREQFGDDYIDPSTGKWVRARRVDLVVGFRRLDELKARIAPYSFTITAAECLELPPRQYTQLPAPLNSAQQRLYDELVSELRAVWDDQEMTAPLALTQLLRLQQLVGGTFTPDDGEPQELSGIPRDRVLLDYLSDVEDKVIIWTRFRPERIRVSALLRKAHGKEAVAEVQNKLQAEREIARFRGEPSCRFLVANPDGAASEGRDFSMARAMVYYSNSFKLTARLQSEARCDHPGKKLGPVSVVDMVAPRTVDVKVVEALRTKRNLAAGFTGAELRRWINGDGQ